MKSMANAWIRTSVLLHHVRPCVEGIKNIVWVTTARTSVACSTSCVIQDSGGAAIAKRDTGCIRENVFQWRSASRNRDVQREWISSVEWFATTCVTVKKWTFAERRMKTALTAVIVQRDTSQLQDGVSIEKNIAANWKLAPKILIVKWVESFNVLPI